MVTVRFRAFSPVATSSRRARSANASAPINVNISCAARNCSRASTRRPRRRSHSPYSSVARASSARTRVRLSRSIASRYSGSALRRRRSRPRPGLQPQRPLGATGAGHRGDPLRRLGSGSGRPAAGGCLDQLGDGPVRHAGYRSPGSAGVAGLLGCGHRFGKCRDRCAARRRPVRDGYPDAFASGNTSLIGVPIRAGSASLPPTRRERWRCTARVAPVASVTTVPRRPATSRQSGRRRTAACSASAERQRKFTQRAARARELDVPSGERVPASSSHRCRPPWFGQPQPAQFLLRGDLAAETARACRRIGAAAAYPSLKFAASPPGAGPAPARRAAAAARHGCAGYLSVHPPDWPGAHEHGGGKPVQIGRPAQARFDGCERLRPSTARRRVPAATRDEGELRPQQVDLGLLEFAQRAGLGHGQQVHRRIERTGLELGLAAAAGPARPMRRVQGQLRARSRNAAAAASPPRARAGRPSAPVRRRRLRPARSLRGRGATRGDRRRWPDR